MAICASPSQSRHGGSGNPTRLLRILAGAFGLLALSAGAIASPKAYVGNSQDNTVSVIDLGDNRVVATVPVADGPHGIAASPDGRWVYVCGDGSSLVSVLDTRTNQVARTIEVGSSPHGARLTPDGGLLLVAVHGDNRVIFIDTATQTVADSTEVAKPHSIAISPDGKLAYVASQGRGRFALAVIDMATHRVFQTIPLENTPRDLEFGQDGMLYLTEAGVNAVEVLDPANNRIVSEIPTGISPHIANLFPHAKLGAVVVQGPSQLALFDPDADKVVRTVDVGKQPHWVTVSSDGKTAYVTNEGSDNVSVIDIASGQTRQSIAVGRSPRKIAIQ